MPDPATITAEMTRLVDYVRLGFVATVNADGTPNLSPKGTVAVWDQRHVVFADIRSPGTILNLRDRPAVEVSVIDPFSRRGYRFVGRARLVEADQEFDDMLAWYHQRQVHSPIGRIVLIEVTKVVAETSPAYDVEGADEAAIRARYAAWYGTSRHEPGEHP